ncbi:MAG: nucleotidyltransferase domain-containing protein [Paludibacteraceae bacterium]|nr:nucleotidyltransferase domain-containing protein [Paludibacteraceae bacterium]MBQ6766341.1 nucleotidyltransferase domain-containing protein [Paludibacteraceae bacterium]
MDNSKVLTRDEALQIVKDYKKVIAPRFKTEPKVYMYGSYSKGYQKPESDIDVAVVVPHVEGDWMDLSTDLWLDVDKVNILIEPVLLEEGHHSPLYDDVMRTGVAVL